MTVGEPSHSTSHGTSESLQEMHDGKDTGNCLPVKQTVKCDSERQNSSGTATDTWKHTLKVGQCPRPDTNTWIPEQVTSLPKKSPFLGYNSRSPISCQHQPPSPGRGAEIHLPLLPPAPDLLYNTSEEIQRLYLNSTRNTLQKIGVLTTNTNF